MSFAQFLAALRARWWVALLVLAVVLAATAAGSLLYPKRYLATATVLIDVRPDPVSPGFYAGMGTAYMQTQVDILGSERVALRVVKLLKLAESAPLRERWMDATEGKSPMEAWLADMVLGGLEVKPGRESNVITVNYKAQEPRYAAALANAFVQAYIAVVLEMRVNPAKEYSTFFDTQLKEARERLEAAQARLSGYQRSNGLLATEERMDIESSRLAELSSQLVGLQGVANDSGSRQAQAQSSPDRVQEVLSNPLIANLKSELNRAEVSLESLVTRLGDSHPQVIEARSNVAELRGKLESETRRVVGGVGVNNSINRSREAQTRASLEAQRSKVLRLRAVRDEGQVLARDVDNAQRTYDAVQTRLTQTNLESQAKQSNVFQLSEASPNTPHPSWR
jgi:polysaccharide biosynthesis transport protein